MKHLEHASETLAKTHEKYLKIIANIYNILIKHLQHMCENICNIQITTLQHVSEKQMKH
jgi:hypothetical protein